MTEQASVPAHPSNRRLYSQMLLWGYTVKSSDGDWMKMKAPTGGTVMIRPPQSHTGTSAESIRQAIAHLDVTKEEFWARTVEVEKPKKPEPPTPKQAPAPALKAQAGLTDNPVQKYRGASNIVFDALVAAGGEPLSTKRIREITGLPINPVNHACHYLRKLGLIERMKSGVYRAKKEHAHTDHRVGIDIDVSDRRDDAPLAEKAAAVPEPEPVTGADVMRQGMAQMQQRAKDENLEDALDDVLDLLFPNGFKARHLKAIEAWKVATIELMREVGS